MIFLRRVLQALPIAAVAAFAALPDLATAQPAPGGATLPLLVGSSSGSTTERSVWRVSARNRPSAAERWSCLARALPSTTGSTISRCDGLAAETGR